MDLHTILGSVQNVSPAQECARAVVVFLFGLVAIRLAGRRIFGRWSAIDTVVAIVFGSSLSRALTGSSPLFGTMAAMSVLLVLHWVLARAAAYWPQISRLVEGVPVVLSRDGENDLSKQKRLAVSVTDLHEALRQNGQLRIDQTSLIVLEPSGKISILAKEH